MEKQVQPFKQIPWQRIVIFTIVFIFIAIGITIWILQSDTNNFWPNLLSIMFVGIGILIALLQWLFPLSASIDHLKSDSITSSQILQPDIAIPDLLPQATDLIGRDNELERIINVVINGELGGMCVITGMSGVGKSALAVKAVTVIFKNHRTAFPGGVAWISCENLKGDEGLSELYLRVASSLNIDSVVQETKLERMRIKLVQALAKRPRTLLALDNLESDFDVDTLIEALLIPNHISLILTAIHISLHVEVDAQIPLETLSTKDAELLFVKLLQKGNISLSNMQDKYAAMSQLVKALGGLPLSIKLTASYAINQKMSLQDILEELHMDELSGAGLNDQSKRGLRKRFDHSWSALPEQQQQLLAGLSLLTGSTFPRTAAEAIAQSIEVANAHSREDVAALVTAMLVEVVIEQDEPTHKKRLRLHPQLRQYASEQLRSFSPEIQERIGDAILDFWDNYVNNHQYSIKNLTREAEGLMGALAWANKNKRYKFLLSIIHILSKPWEAAGRRGETALFYAWAIEAAKRVNDVAEESWFMFKAILNEAWLGKITATRAHFQQALDLAVQSQNISIELEIVYEVAKIDEIQGRVTDAQAGFKRARKLADQLKDPVEKVIAECKALHELSRNISKQAERILDNVSDNKELNVHEQLELMHLQADQKLKEAHEGFEHELILAKQLNGSIEGLEFERGAIHELARIDEIQGKLKEAHQGFEQALNLSRRLENPFDIAMDQRHLGFIIGREGHFKKGSTMIKDALKYFQQSGDQYASGLCYLRLAELERDSIQKINDTHHKQAVSYFLESLQRFKHVKSSRVETVRKELRKLGEDINNGQ